MMLRDILLGGETVVADSGYQGDSKIVVPEDAISERHWATMEVARARHEAINGRLKQWGALKNQYQHTCEKHYLIFSAIIVMEQLWIEQGKVLWQIRDFIHDFALAV